MTEIWTAILKQIEGKLDPKELKTWFGPTRQVAFDSTAGAGVLTISVPSRVFADWIQSRHGELLAREAAGAGYPELTIRFEAVGPEGAESVAATATAPGQFGRVSASTPRFSFENFVVGPSNLAMVASCTKRAPSPSTTDPARNWRT